MYGPVTECQRWKTQAENNRLEANQLAHEAARESARADDVEARVRKELDDLRGRRDYHRKNVNGGAHGAAVGALNAYSTSIARIEEALSPQTLEAEG